MEDKHLIPVFDDPDSSEDKPPSIMPRPARRWRVAVIANVKGETALPIDAPADAGAEFDRRETIQAIQDAIESDGHETVFLPADASLTYTLREVRPDICFNICEGHFGDAREAQVPAILEMLRVRYTGSKVLTLALALDKPMTKRILTYHDLPTPEFQSFERVDEPLGPEMRFPLFVKPSREGTGMGVTAKSIVHNEAELREQIAHIIKKYKQTALVERYIEGREVTVGLVGNLIGPVSRRLPNNENAPRIQAGLRFFPPLEVDLNPYKETDAVYSNRLKVDLADQLNYLCPAPLDDEMVDELNWLTAAVFRVTGALDVSRVDYRLDADDNWKPYILEINPLPGLSAVSDLVIEAASEGVAHTHLVNMILDTALERYGLK